MWWWGHSTATNWTLQPGFVQQRWVLSLTALEVLDLRAVPAASQQLREFGTGPAFKNSEPQPQAIAYFTSLCFFF